MQANDSRDEVPIYNESGERIPPYALCQSTGQHDESDGSLHVQKPDADSLPGLIVNGPTAIEQGEFGSGTLATREILTIDTADGDPSPGDQYGSQSGEWLAKKGNAGFRVLSGTGNRVNATRDGAGAESCELEDFNTNDATRNPGPFTMPTGPGLVFSVGAIDPANPRQTILKIDPGPGSVWVEAGVLVLVSGTVSVTTGGAELDPPQFFRANYGASARIASCDAAGNGTARVSDWVPILSGRMRGFQAPASVAVYPIGLSGDNDAVDQTGTTIDGLGTWGHAVIALRVQRPSTDPLYLTLEISVGTEPAHLWALQTSVYYYGTGGTWLRAGPGCAHLSQPPAVTPPAELSVTIAGEPAPGSVCEGSPGGGVSVTFTATPAGGTGVYPLYVFTTSDGQTESGPSDSATFVLHVGGPYTAGVVVTDSSSASAGDTTADYNVGGTPVADFSQTVTSGSAPLVDDFTDLSTNTPTSWLWEYNKDGAGWTTFSTVQNPTHTFTLQGVYDIRLTATNGCGSNTRTVAGAVTVLP